MLSRNNKHVLSLLILLIIFFLVAFLFPQYSSLLEVENARLLFSSSLNLLVFILGYLLINEYQKRTERYKRVSSFPLLEIGSDRKTILKNEGEFQIKVLKVKMAHKIYNFSELESTSPSFKDTLQLFFNTGVCTDILGFSNIIAPRTNISIPLRIEEIENLDTVPSECYPPIAIKFNIEYQYLIEDEESYFVNYYILRYPEGEKLIKNYNECNNNGRLQVQWLWNARDSDFYDDEFVASQLKKTIIENSLGYSNNNWNIIKTER